MSVRTLVYEVLNDIYFKKSYSNIALNQAIIANPMSEQDKGLMTRIVYGVLQNSILLEYIMQQYTGDKKIDPEMKTILKMGLYQLFFMDKIPSYAIINEAVELTKDKLGINASKFTNGVLRSATKDPYVMEPSDFDDNIGYLCTKYSHPEWLVRMMIKHYGEEPILKSIVKNLEAPNLALRVNTLKTSRSELLKFSPDFKAGNLAPDAVIYIGNEGIGNTKAFEKGLVTVQDESAQLVVPLLDPKPNDLVLDMCAAPGTKSTHMAALMQNKGEIMAVDVYEHRLALLRNAVRRLDVTCVTPQLYDATKLNEVYKDETFDKILLDAPCSGFGVIRRKPDILIQTKQEDLDGLIKLQKALIDTAVKLLKKGGNLVYSTCTLDKKENEMQVDYLLSKYSEFKLVSKRIIFPYEYDSDGFFMAKFVKE